MEEDRKFPETDRPLNAPRRRPTLGPALVVVGLLLGVLAILAVITLLRYQT